MDATAWDKYAGATEQKPTRAPTPKPDAPSGATLDLAVAVMQGKYGAGQDRKNALGTRYQEVQDFINHIASASTDTLVKEVMQGKYGNGETRKAVLGSKYKAVQDKLTEVVPVLYTIQCALEIPYLVSLLSMALPIRRLQQMNGLTNPNKIYVGQKLRVK